LADYSARQVQHLPHARSTRRTFIAHDDDIAGTNLACLHGREAIFLTVEDASWPPMEESIMAGKLHHAALGGEGAAEDRQAASWLEWSLDRRYHSLARAFHGPFGNITDG
jgi:hypothetical protein